MQEDVLADLNLVASVAERDVDMLILEEIHVNTAFGEWIAGKVFGGGCWSLDGAWHSVTDSALGESDLILRFRSGQGVRHAVLMENKIGAPRMPRQAERYAERGAKGTADGFWDAFVTCLFAPEAYFSRLAENETFDARLAYEEVKDWFMLAGLGKRGEYRARIIQEAIEQNRRGYRLVPDPKVTDFWLRYWQYCIASYPDLSMVQPGPRPAGSDWPNLKAKGLPKSACFIHKLAMGLMDLSFSGANAEALAAEMQGMLVPEMQVVQTGKSAVIRIEVPKVDRFSLFDVEREKVDAGFRAAMRILTAVRSNPAFF